MSWKYSYSHLMILKLYNGIQLRLAHLLKNQGISVMQIWRQYYGKFCKGRDFVLIIESKAPSIKWWRVNLR